MVFGRCLPTAFRTFLLSLAVMDNLLGIVVSALFQAAGQHLQWLGGAVAATALFAFLVRRSGAAAQWALFPPTACPRWSPTSSAGSIS